MGQAPHNNPGSCRSNRSTNDSDNITMQRQGGSRPPLGGKSNHKIMSMENVLTVTTTRGELRYTINDDGFIIMQNTQTVKRYHQLRWEEQPDLDQMGVFFAFSPEQFENGVERLTKRGFIKSKGEIRRGPANSLGTPQSLSKMMKWYAAQDKKILQECDPQEVYFYEFNNHETPYGWDGDIEVMRIIASIWGYDTAIKLKRHCKSSDKAIEELKTI